MQTDIKNPVGEARTLYTYSGKGEKLRVVRKWNPNYSATQVIGSAVNESALTKTETTDYVGNIVYETGSDGTVKSRILIDGGYIENGVYHFYVPDHLGSVRLVVNQSRTVVQKNHYYPFGLSFAEGLDREKQPYKYTGKELEMKQNMQLYDYSARYYDPTIGRFTTIDPLAEKYYSVSPYAYCANNPARYIDPTGMVMDDYYSEKGYYLGRDNKKTDNIRIVSDENLPADPKDLSKIKNTLDIGDANITAEAYSRMFTHILSTMDGIDLKLLTNERISVAVFDGDENVIDTYNYPSTALGQHASKQDDRGRLIITASLRNISKKREANYYLYSTVSNVQNMLGVHEFMGHGVNRWSAWKGTHHKVFEYQMVHPTWEKTSLKYKLNMISIYNNEKNR